MAGAPITSLTKETPGLIQVWILERRSKNAESKRDKKIYWLPFCRELKYML